MTRTVSIHRFTSAFAICLIFALGVCLGGCNDRSTSKTTRDTHEQHADHDDHDHGGHDHDEHGGHDNDGRAGHEGHDHDEHSDGEQSHKDNDHDGVLRIEPSELREFSIDIATAGSDTLTRHISLPGELTLNPDNVAHVVPRVAGVTRSVHKSVGNDVQEGELLAVLDSRELAQTKAQYLATSARERIAKVNFAREEKLWKSKISAERAFLVSKQAIDEAQIARTLAERELHALGLSEDDVKSIPDQSEVEYTRYQLTAPIAGTVIERHLVRGEVVKEDADDPTFVIADLSSVWLSLTVYTTHLDQVRPGQKVLVILSNLSEPIPGTIDYVTPLIDESTRTATARVVLPNPDGTLRPGLFVTATLTSDTITPPILIPNTAIQIIDERPTVFVRNVDGFTPVTITLGASNETHSEVRSGLNAGDSFVSRGGGVLKTEMKRSELEHAGHVH